MADEQRVSQAGVTVLGTPSGEELQVSQAGATIPGAVVNGALQVSQAGATIVARVGSVWVHGTAFGNGGEEIALPVRGDRAAWDTDKYPEHHAIDLKDDLPQRHNPWPMPAGYVAQSDGSKLVPTDNADQAELDAHEANADAHHDQLHAASHENGGGDEINVAGLSGVLADRQDADKLQGRAIATDVPADGEALLWDVGANEWVPTDVATQAELDAHTTAHTSDPGATSKPLSTDANGYLDLVRLYLDELHAETTVQLGDDAGANKLIIKDSSAAEIASLDSDGLLTTRTLLVVPAASTDTVFRTQSLQSTAPLGGELVTNGTFDSDLSGWTIGGGGTGWSWDAAGKALHATGNVDTLYQNINVVDGTTYQVEFTISDRTAGSVTIDVGAVHLYNYGTIRTFTSGVWQKSLVASGTGTQTLTITPTTDFDGKIDNITVKPITGGSQANAVYLDDDGEIAVEIRGDYALSNLFVGRAAGEYTTVGDHNVAIGYNALSSNTTGHDNVALGSQALSHNSIGYHSIAIGGHALQANSSGFGNVAVGEEALYANTTGWYNIAIGMAALKKSTTSRYNTAIGVTALPNVTTGAYYNTAIGYNTGRGITTGDYNTIIGAQVAGLDPDLHDTIIIATGQGVIRILTNDAGDTRIGTATDHALISSDGVLTLVGSARVTRDLWIDAAGIKAPGAKPATEVSFGTLEVAAWEFSNEGVEANQESVSWRMAVPYDMDRSVGPSIRLGWSSASTGNCRWQLKYRWFSEDEDLTQDGEETLTVTDAASATANGLVVTDITGIDAPSGTDATIMFKLTRLSADAADTISDTVELHGVCFNYTSNKLGEAI